ncbi:dihydroxyacetone kinase family protein [Cereibacter johrii]|uniref:dihydroxyacetone kinase family protein n=1 Tax=Cereibacter johrii TaxID=445629 RepID=UPI000DCE7873|nr:dihydroxyacetone kinase family protein [Cereibacter johrii]RAZ87153.1 dihydroxyacetone kinase [Cereibacter johrii]
MKKLINSPRRVVPDLLAAMVAQDPSLCLLEGENVLLRADIPEDPADRAVALISGGGSGHEPAHGGYVGKGMLSAAVAGDVFTSPSVDAILSAILASAGPAGALLIVKNYTGDRLNFSLAAELAAAEDIPCEVVFVADDAALRDLVSRDRRRGLAGTVLVHKAAGAAAEAGLSLSEVTAVARGVADDLVTMGVGLGACIVPTAGQPSFELGDEEVEYGLGIHGEKGVERGPMADAATVTRRILDTLEAEMGAALKGPLGLMVNGLGATPPMELGIVAGEALAQLKQRGADVQLIWTGNFMTALEMPGASITLLPLDAERRKWLEAPTGVRVWPSSATVGMAGRSVHLPRPAETIPEIAPGPLTPVLKAAVERVAAALIAAEPHLTDLDSKAGDGDLGASMFRAAEAIRALPEAAYNHPAQLFVTMAATLRRAIAGSSGPFYATALMRAARPLEKEEVPSAEAWDAAFAAGVAAVSAIGGAQPGDRTMVDALDPALKAWGEQRAANASLQEALAAAAKAAESGADATARMTPKLGRASYLGARAVGTNDGGAEAVAYWLAALAKA